MGEATGVITAKKPASTTLYFGPLYRKSPYFEATLRHGCTAYDIYNHMYLPSYFHDPIEEYWATLGQPEQYRPGTWGPKSADEMLARDGRVWRRP